MTSDGHNGVMTAPPRIAICICTNDRPEILERCLLSIAKGTSQPETVWVSDDSKQPEKTRETCARYPFVSYVQGPRKGLCANRNAVLKPVVEEFVSLIDDDGIVSTTFVEQLRRLLPELPQKTIVTGDVLEYGGRTTPRNPSFLGHFSREPGDLLETINLNCNCFPREAFRVAQFDEQIVYGYEDMDLCSSLLAKGFGIVHDPALANEHRPVQRNTATDPQRNRFAEQARFQTSMRRYLLWEGRAGKALLYLVVAPLHRTAHAVKTGSFADVPRAFFDIGLATLQALRGVRGRRSGEKARRS